ncbi:hypothetical protein PFNF54_05861 [Plasmodium falciparum NF54]|uniref:Nucleoporin NUP116/NSP116 n=1 Tax=Plasmodium falciparum (isolate NF54) TaxID=5843 RepID=W7JKY9_PLAFO|nr:hypothetical protein PFNF54_05861 [Plasmodium falciparum NF54]
MSRKLSNVITSNKGNSMELFVNVLNWAIPKTEVNEMLKKYNVVSLECFVKNYRIYKADKMRNILSAVVGIVVKKHFKCVILKKSYFLQWDISDFMGNVVSVYVNINKHTNIEFIEEGNLVILVNPDIHRRNEYSGDESIDFYNLHDIINVGKVAYMHKCKARNIYNDTCPYLLYVPRQGYFCSHHIGSQSRSQSYSADEGKNCLVFEFPIIHNTEEDSTEEDNTEEQNKRRHNAKEDNTQKFSHSTHKLHANSLIKPIPCKKTNFKNSNHLDNDMLSEYNLNANYDSTSDSIHFYESLSERNDTNFLSSSKEKSKQNPLQLSRETVRVQKPFEGKNEINKPSDEFCYVHQSLYELNKLRNRSDQAYIAHNTSSRKFGAQNMSGGTYQAQNTSGGMYEAQNTSGGIYGAQNTLRETYGAQNTGIYGTQNMSSGIYGAHKSCDGTNRMLKSLNREKKVDNLSYIKNILQQQLFPKEKTGESLSYMNQIQKLPFKRSRIIHTSDAIKEIVQPHQRKKLVEKKGCEKNEEVEKKGCENKGCEKNEVEKTSYEQNEVEKTSYEQKEILQLLQKFNKLFQKRSSKDHKMKRKRGREEDDNKYSSDSFIKRKKCSKMNPHNAREGGCGTYLKTEDKYGKMNIFINGNKMNQNKQLLPENEERKVKNILDENKKEIDKKSTNYDVYNDLNNCGHKNVICIECLNRYRRKNDSAENSNECGKHIYGEEKKTEDNIKTVILDCARENDIEIDMGEEIKNNEKFIDASVGYENKLNTNGNEENTETLYLMRPFHAILNEIENAEKEGEKGIDKIVMNIKNITRNFIYYADDFKNTRIIKICERLMLHKSMYIAILALDLRRKIGNLKENQEVETNVQI